VDWKVNHPAEWTQDGQESKFVEVKIIKTILREDIILNVGDVLVANRKHFHKLAIKSQKDTLLTLKRIGVIRLLD